MEIIACVFIDLLPFVKIISCLVAIYDPQRVLCCVQRQGRGARAGQYDGEKVRLTRKYGKHTNLDSQT